MVVLTGAGCSTESGIPDYRGPNGTWHRRRPMNYSEFLRSAESRRHFWARNYTAWPRFSSSQPNRAHLALARLEETGKLHQLVTQNVDGLHQRAGSKRVIELHGRTSEVVCIGCGDLTARAELQQKLDAMNASWNPAAGRVNADGDVELSRDDTASFEVPDCSRCAGVLKPNVVFFGDSVPRWRVDEVMQQIRESDLLLVAGSSLTVWSGYRFAKAAVDFQVPLAIINLGETRADAIATVKLEANVGDAIEAIAALPLQPELPR